MVTSEGVVSDLVAIIGKESVSGDIFNRVTYGQDAFGPDLEKEKVPIAVVRPESAQQVSKLLVYANKHKIPVYVRGSGTAFKGSSRPKREGSIILSMEKFTSFEMHENDMYFEVGAGVVQLDLEQKLAERGYMLPLNVGSKFSGTIGGAVAINTIGHMVDTCIGKTIDYVMGVEAVLPTGEIVETGTKSIRRPAGIDLTRFFAATEGVFGVITRIRMRLLLDPKKAYVVGFFKELEDIARAFIRIYEEKLPPPLYGELLSEEACVAPFRLRKLGKPKGSMALATTIGHTQEDADRQAEDIARVFKVEKAIEAHVVTDAKEKEALWASRDNIMNVLGVEEGEEKLLLGGVVECPVPLHALPDLIKYFRTGHKHSILHEAKLLIYGHVGAADLHAMWGVPASWPPEKRRQSAIEASQVESEVYLKWGSTAGEVGQTALRMACWREMYGEAAYSMLLNIKKAVDPNGILNPGNLLEDEGKG